jgi:hypothetical protein
VRVVGALVALSLVASCKSLLGIDDGVVASSQDSGTDAPDDSAPDDADVDAPIDASLAWWDPTFTSRRSITLDTTALTLPIANLPVLVRIPTAVAVELSTNGADVRFVSDDHATALTFELDATSITAIHAWVKVSLVSANQRIWLYYGKPTATSASSGAMVFDDYESVHHLANEADASGNGHNVSTQSPGTNPTVIDGIVGRARQFDGNDDYLALAAGDGPFDFTATMSVSAWFRASKFTVEWQPIVAKGDTSWRVHRDQMTNRLAFGTGVAGTTDNLNTSSDVEDGAWHHVLVSRDATSKRIYIDGVLEGERLSPPAIPTNGLSVRIGSNEQVNRMWAGDIDEVRISPTTRSAAWARAEYVMVTSQTFATFGARETYP